MCRGMRQAREVQARGLRQICSGRARRGITLGVKLCIRVCVVLALFASAELALAQSPAPASSPSLEQRVADLEAYVNNSTSLGAFPAHAQVLQSDLEQITRNLKTNYPNIKLAYFSSRTRAYTNDPTTLNPEPFAYESAFAVRWTIADQLSGAGNLNFDPTRGAVVAPWLGWASYLWADGTNPRSDGFTWLCSDVRSDFTHPPDSGRNKVAHELLAFFKTHATALPWFLQHTLAGELPTCSASASTTSGVAPLNVSFSATASDPDGTITQYV
jgi:hypothetical protein